MPDYSPVYGKPQELTYLAGATIIGGQLLAFSAQDTVIPTSGASLLFAGVAGQDAANGAYVTAQAGTGLIHETLSTQLPPPPSPVVTPSATGGTVVAGTYQVSLTYVNGQGESLPSVTVPVVVPGTTLGSMVITSPVASVPAGATGWYAYVSQAGATPQTRQQAPGSPTAMASNLTITAPPTSSGLAPTTANTTGPVPGNLLATAATGLVNPGAAAGAEVGVAVRGVSATGLVRWKTTRG